MLRRNIYLNRSLFNPIGIAAPMILQTVWPLRNKVCISNVWREWSGAKVAYMDEWRGVLSVSTIINGAWQTKSLEYNDIVTDTRPVSNTVGISTTIIPFRKYTFISDAVTGIASWRHEFRFRKNGVDVDTPTANIKSLDNSAGLYYNTGTKEWVSNYNNTGLWFSFQDIDADEVVIYLNNSPGATTVNSRLTLIRRSV